MFWRKHLYFAVILLVMLSIILPNESWAEDDEYEVFRLFVVGVAVINTGAATLNGVSLVAGDPSFTRGFGGFLIGFSTGVMAIVATVESESSPPGFGWVLVGASSAAVVTGALCMILTDHKSFKPRQENRLSVLPSFDFEVGKRQTIGFEVRFRF